MRAWREVVGGLIFFVSRRWGRERGREVAHECSRGSRLLGLGELGHCDADANEARVLLSAGFARSNCAKATQAPLTDTVARKGKGVAHDG